VKFAFPQCAKNVTDGAARATTKARRVDHHPWTPTSICNCRMSRACAYIILRRKGNAMPHSCINREFALSKTGVGQNRGLQGTGGCLEDNGGLAAQEGRVAGGWQDGQPSTTKSCTRRSLTAALGGGVPNIQLRCQTPLVLWLPQRTPPSVLFPATRTAPSKGQAPPKAEGSTSAPHATPRNSSFGS